MIFFSQLKEKIMMAINLSSEAIKKGASIIVTDKLKENK